MLITAIKQALEHNALYIYTHKSYMYAFYYALENQLFTKFYCYSLTHICV